MGKINKEMVDIEGRTLTLTNLDKVFWPDKKLTKAHLIKYYLDIAHVLLPYIHNRPLVMKRYPDGIKNNYFYQKECPSYAPDWVITHPVTHSRKVINYIICNDKAALTWLANQGCVEIHAWLSRLEDIDYPDLAVFDLDPADGVQFKEVLRVAVLVHEVLLAYNLQGFPKTSGSSGMHIFIPLNGKHTFPEVTEAMKFLAEIIIRAYPQGVTVERVKEKRKGKVYLDYLQNGRGKTMAFPYSLRPLPGAPVSAPLTWDEVNEMNIKPLDFNLNNIFERINKTQDFYSGLLGQKNDLAQVIRNIPSAKIKQTVVEANFI